MIPASFPKALLSIPLFCISCTIPKAHYADEIVAKSIQAHGGQEYENSVVEFDFRGMHIRLKRYQGEFEYSREFERDGDKVLDILSNGGFRRYVDEQQTALSPVDSARFASSVNSVAYFALLPFPLNDPGVIKKFNRALFIKGEPYYEIAVSFTREAGGKDFEDEFVYWFHQEHFTMDYLAYKYNDTDDGTRFRHAIKKQKVEGILLADYHNYAAAGIGNLQDYQSLFEKNDLKKVSEIVLNNVSVTRYKTVL